MIVYLVRTGDVSLYIFCYSQRLVHSEKERERGNVFLCLPVYVYVCVYDHVELKVCVLW